MKSPVASLLWRSLKTYQVFGANTEVGKTIFTTLLARTAQARGKDEKVTFLKPVSTGALADADDGSRHTLFQYDIPCSPHSAAVASGRTIPSDDALLQQCRAFAAKCAELPGWLFIETAGGVHSPAPSGKTQADVYIPLRAPTLLIGDAKLGGISQTIAAFEALRIRGYDIESVLLFRDETYRNYEYLQQYFAGEYDIPVEHVAAPPERNASPDQDALALREYYDSQASTAAGVLEQLDENHALRLRQLDEMAGNAHKHIWYPFTQQHLVSKDDIMAIDSAYGDYFQTVTPDASVLRSSFDASASWWTQGLGHANPKLTLAAGYAAGRYGHVMFASAVHQPAMELAQTLLAGMGNPRLSRVFYSDNGSTGTEVAVKMGLRAARRRYGWHTETGDKVHILGLRGGYHGDTMGAMDCAEPCAYNEQIEWYEGKGMWLDYPTVLCTDGKWGVTVREELRESLGEGRAYNGLGDVFDVEAREARGEHKAYEAYIVDTLTRARDKGFKFGALIMEPIVLGAGGMELVDPLFQRTLVNTIRSSPHLFSKSATRGASDETDWSGLPIIFDEVFTGLYRLGRFSPASFLGVNPDISVHAKLLTGGLVPLCTTLASEHIFDVFRSNDKAEALLHGHSYTAHPIGCQVALESVKTMQGMEKRGEWDWAKQDGWVEDKTVWSTWPQGFVKRLSEYTENVAGVWALGSVLAIHLKDAAGAGYSSNAALGLRQQLLDGREGPGGPWNVHSRVLGNVLYVMASQTTSPESVANLAALLEDSIRKGI